MTYFDFVLYWRLGVMAVIMIYSALYSANIYYFCTLMSG